MHLLCTHALNQDTMLWEQGQKICFYSLKILPIHAFTAHVKTDVVKQDDWCISFSYHFFCVADLMLLLN